MTATGIEELELARGMDSALAHLLPTPKLLEAAGTDTQLDESTQRGLLELGGVSVAVPEALGGLELPWHQSARLAAVAGRRLLPSAIRGEAFVLAPALAALAHDGDREAAGWLDQLLAGELRGGAVSIAAERTESVAYLPRDARLLACIDGDEVAVLELGAGGIATEPILGVDPGQGAVLVRRQGPLGGRRLGRAAAAATCDWWLVANVSEAFGAAQRCLELSCAYAAEREQFGAKLVSFQAVSHRLAQMAVALEAADAGIGRLVARLEAGEPDPMLALALSHAVPAAARVTCEGAIQVHGGTGFTWEYGLHLYYRRVLAIEAELGGSSGSARAAGRQYLESVGG
jgi:alkylation response protein AidB-like acyl-CoA dehydrogenase